MEQPGNVGDLSPLVHCIGERALHSDARSDDALPE
jgi:hypothetical protein